LDLAGAVVTADALHTVRANLDWLVTDKNAHYIAVVKQNQPLLHAQVRALPWRQVPAGAAAREKGHGRAETRTIKAAHVSGLDFPHARQAIKITRWRQEAGTGRATRQAVYAVTTLTSADATADGLARLVREHWSIEAHHHVRDVPSAKTPPPAAPAAGRSTWPPSAPPSPRPSRTPAICTSLKDAATTPLPPRPSGFTASAKGQMRTFAEHDGALRTPGLGVLRQGQGHDDPREADQRGGPDRPARPRPHHLAPAAGLAVGTGLAGPVRRQPVAPRD
jgi:predicted transposase YbfD/YdcC